MYYKHFRPVAALTPYIDCFWIIEASTEPGVTKYARMPADSRATLLLNFTGEPRMTTSEGITHSLSIGAHLLGTHTQSYVLEHAWGTHLIAAQFRPGGLASFVRCRVSELAEEMIPLNLLWDTAGNWLFEQIY
jgi:hypothetical protein